MSLMTSYFFDLTHFKHKKLFNHSLAPWQALADLMSYLANYPLGLIEAEISPEAYLIDPQLISIGKGSIVEPGAYIKGPCIIGANCIIRHGAYIRGNVITGDSCVIGHASEVKHAIFLDQAHAAHFAYIGNSILGNKVNLGAGVRCANFKLDHSLINVHYKDQSIATGMRKLGAIIGDGAQIGCNCVTNPGAMIGKDVYSYPCLNIRGCVPSRSFIKPSDQPIITPY